MVNISPGPRCCKTAVEEVVDTSINSCFGGGNGILASIDPALFIIRMVVLDPNPEDPIIPFPPPPPPAGPLLIPLLSSGMVTAAIGPPLGHPATSVVVVVDNNRATSEASPDATF